MDQSVGATCQRCDDLTDDHYHVCQRCRRRCVDEFDQKMLLGLGEPYPLPGVPAVRGRNTIPGEAT